MKGVINVGNSCYLGSTLQLLAHCTPFVNAILTARDGGDAGGERHITMIVGEIVHLMQTDKTVRSNTVINPKKLILGLRQTDGSFDYLVQNDAQEFVALLLNRMIEESIATTTSRRPSIDHRQASTHRPLLATFMDKQWSKNVPYSSCRRTAVECFQGQYVSQVKCGNCKRSYHNSEVLTMLPLDTAKDVTTSLASFFRSEPVPGWRCDRCKDDRSGVKVYRCWRAPRVLLLMIKRFTFEGAKNTSPVDIPLRLDMAPFVAHGGGGGGPETNMNTNYELCSFVCHSGGGGGSGHYTTVGKKGESWLLYDDERVGNAHGGVRDYERSVYILGYKECTLRNVT